MSGWQGQVQKVHSVHDGISLHHKTENKGQNDCDYKEKTQLRHLAGETLHFFLLAGFSKLLDTHKSMDDINKHCKALSGLRDF